MSVQDLLKNKRDEILGIAAKHGAYNVRVFGSVIHGDEEPESDIDFLIDVGVEHSKFFPGGLIVDLEDLLGRRVDIVTENALHWYIRDRVLKEESTL